MSQQRRGPQRGLGKGLGALIPSQEAPSPTAASVGAPPPDVPMEVSGARFAEIPIDEVTPNPRQPRMVFDDEALEELAYSIREIGLLQPIVVRPVGAEPQTSARYELIAGERRLRACRLAGLAAVPAIIRQTDDEAMLRDALLENLHRANLNPLEEAAAYQQLLEDFGCTQDELAQRIGRSRPQVTNTLRLLRLPTSVQSKVSAGVITAGHARALLGMQDPGAMEAMAGRIVREGLSVRSVEELVMVSDHKEASTSSARRRKPRSQGVSEVIGDVAQRLSDALDTRVTVVGLRSAKTRGRVVIEVADMEDLRRIADLVDRG